MSSGRARKILVVDDEPSVTGSLEVILSGAGFEVLTANSFAAATAILNRTSFDLVITDLAMPNMDGLELCKQLRAISQIPIIILSAKGEERIKVTALDIGADDFVTKPFGIDELLARLRAALRRAQSQPANATEQKTLSEGDFHIELEARNVTVAGREIHLTPKEFELLVYFLKHSGKVLTHRTLLAAVWGGDYVEQDQYLRVFVGNLRKKLETNPAAPKYILTEPWVGYRFSPTEAS